MTMTSISPVELEPPAWLYHLMARGPIFRRIYRRLVADLGGALPLGAQVLDVGTGPGFLLKYLATQRPDLSLVGLDFDYQMIRRARRGKSESGRQAPLAWVVANALALPFPHGIFQRALATFTFHIWPQKEAGLREILRVLQPGGRAWVYEMNREASRHDLRAFAREEKLPFPLIYLGFKTISWGHGLGAGKFTAILQQAEAAKWNLHPVHHLFWRAEIEA
jgi:ubiquinone/menaquinone biosynthesis C-methylase UbiE